MALYGVVVADPEVAGAHWEVTGSAGAVTGAGGEGAMTVGKDVPLAVTAVLARPVLDPSPQRYMLPFPRWLLPRLLLPRLLPLPPPLLRCCY